jgi:apolipoprotein N-acyltransferase
MSSAKKKTTTKTKRIKTKKEDNTELANSPNLPSLIEDTWFAGMIGVIGFEFIGLWWFGIDFYVLLGMAILQIPMGLIIGFVIYKAIIPVLTKVLLIELSKESKSLIKQILIFLGPSLTFWILTPVS